MDNHEDNIDVQVFARFLSGIGELYIIPLSSYREYRNDILTKKDGCFLSEIQLIKPRP